MNEVVEWTNQAVLALVQEYEKHEELWNRNHNMYRVQSLKNGAWDSIAALFDCDTLSVRKKFNSVLASYRRERTKVKEGWKTNWYLYRHLKFLRGYVESPEQDQCDETEISENYEQVETLEPEYNSDDTHVSEDDDPETEILIEHKPQVRAFIHKRIVPVRNKKKVIATAKKKPKRLYVQSKEQQEMYSKMYVDSKILEMQRMMKKESLKKKDDCDMFGEYIASIIRKHDNKTQCIIKQAINNILFEQEMNKYENPLETDNMVTEILDEQ